MLATKSAGFTLIELIIGIIVLAVALAGLTTLVFRQTIQSVDPIYNVRAAELAQSLMNEIMGKAFDENSSRSNSLLRCDEIGSDACVNQSGLGPDAENTNTFDDVDDYNNYDLTKLKLANVGDYTDLYKNYNLLVQVGYDSDFDGNFDDGDIAANRRFKLIIIDVTTPANDTIRFATYKGNY